MLTEMHFQRSGAAKEEVQQNVAKDNYTSSFVTVATC
jgi:hypothetical protein